MQVASSVPYSKEVWKISCTSYAGHYFLILTWDIAKPEYCACTGLAQPTRLKAACIVELIFEVFMSSIQLCLSAKTFKTSLKFYTHLLTNLLHSSKHLKFHQTIVTNKWVSPTFLFFKDNLNTDMTCTLLFTQSSLPSSRQNKKVLNVLHNDKGITVPQNYCTVSPYWPKIIS